MSSRSHERRTERATAEEVAEVERQLWEFAKRIDPPSVPEAKLRPGAFLYRVHRTWHSLGRGTGGLASRSFRALRDELLQRDPPVRNLQPKLYGNTPLAHAEAEQLIDVMLETWHLERNRNGKWQARPLARFEESEPADGQDLETIRENLLHTLFKSEDNLLLEEPVGVPPEIFMEERGRSSLALIIPTKAETLAHLSPSNAYGGLSGIVGRFFDAAIQRHRENKPLPILIWLLKLGVIRDNADFHQDFHCLATYSASLTNWYFRLSRIRGDDKKEAQKYWKMIVRRSAFVIHGLPDWTLVSKTKETKEDKNSRFLDDHDLGELTPNFFIPNPLPIMLSNHRQVKRHSSQDFGLNVSIEPDPDNPKSAHGVLRYWLFPDQPKEDLEETAETTGLPVFNAEISPGQDYDLAFTSVYEATQYYLGVSDSPPSKTSYRTLKSMGWRILTITQLQKALLVAEALGGSETH